MSSRPKTPTTPRALPVRLPVAGRAEPPPERADAARNRARILSAARKLLGRRPIHEICMDELAKAAGVGKGTLYRRFADRSSLCLALLDDGERDLQERVLARFGLPSDAPAIEHLFVLLEALVAFTMENAALLAEAAAFERGWNFGVVDAHHAIDQVVARNAQLPIDDGLEARGSRVAQDFDHVVHRTATMPRWQT